MARPLISIIHPTARVKPGKLSWRTAFDLYLSRADHPEEIEYVLAVHESRWEEFWQSNSRGGAWGAFRLVENKGRDCAVDQVNAAARVATGLLLHGVQDDIEPPAHWDTLLLEAWRTGADQHGYGSLNDGEPNLDAEAVIVCSTGLSRERELELMMCGAVTRATFERRGYCVHPDFESMYADNYYAWENRRDEAAGRLKVIERLNIHFKHNRVEADEVYEQQNRRDAYRHGLRTFRRLTQGTRLIALCLPGETFSFRYMFAMFATRDYLQAANFIVEDYGAHTTNVYSTRIELADAVIQRGMSPEFVLWVDDDNVISPENASMLIADLDAHPELDWVAGCCWCDTGDYENHPFVLSFGRQGPKLECNLFGVEDWCKFQAAKKLSVTSDDVAPDALWSGMPVVLMRGSMLERLGWEAFKPMLGDYHRGFTSEDTTFFYRAHQAGIKGAVDLRVMVPHLKLRGIQPQILPASEREKVLEYMAALEKTFAPVANETPQAAESCAAD